MSLELAAIALKALFDRRGSSTPERGRTFTDPNKSRYGTPTRRHSDVGRQRHTYKPPTYSTVKQNFKYSNTVSHGPTGQSGNKFKFQPSNTHL